jgi:hypothetical protein
VEPRVYRFSELNASPSRHYSVKFLAETKDGKHQAWMDFYVFGESRRKHLQPYLWSTSALLGAVLRHLHAALERA